MTLNYKRRRVRTYFLAFLLGLAFLFLIFSFLIRYSPPEQTIQIIVSVGPYAGFNVNSSLLHFGTLLPGSRAERTIHLRVQERSNVFLSSDLPFILIEPSSLILEPDLDYLVRIIALIPKEQPLGLYSGTLLIRTQSI
ncbi:MAG: hypothetical protein AABX72_02455 [Nanoarchaeota archaeon]